MGLLAWPTSVWNWIRGLGPIGLLLLGIADSGPFFDAPPGSVDTFLILLCAGSHELWAFYALMATIGEVIGGYLTYRIAEKGGQETLEKKVGKARVEKVYKSFEKHGFITVFGGAVAPPPFPFSPVPVAAGILQYPQRKFVLALAAGRGLRFFTEAFLGRTYGPQMIAFFSTHYQAAVNTLIAFAVLAGIGALIYYKHTRGRNKAGEPVNK
jgi:membrane protein YqaA with SNARE-associated domain